MHLIDGASDRVRRDIDDVGMGHDADIPSALEVLAVVPAEAGVTLVHLPEGRTQQVVVEGQGLDLKTPPGAFVVYEGAQLQVLLGLLVVGVEVSPGEGPAAVGDPGPLLEIHRIQGNTTPAPDERRATEESKARVV